MKLVTGGEPETQVIDKAKYYFDDVEEQGLPLRTAYCHGGLVAAWLVERGCLVREFEPARLAQDYAQGRASGSSTPALLYEEEFDGCLVSDMMDERTATFLVHLFDSDRVDGWFGLLGEMFPVSLYPPDAWTAYDAMKPRLDAAWEAFDQADRLGALAVKHGSVAQLLGVDEGDLRELGILMGFGFAWGARWLAERESGAQLLIDRGGSLERETFQGDTVERLYAKALTRRESLEGPPSRSVIVWDGFHEGDDALLLELFVPTQKAPLTLLQRYWPRAQPGPRMREWTESLLPMSDDDARTLVLGIWRGIGLLSGSIEHWEPIPIS